MENSNFSLINFDGAADVVNNVIDKVASAVGWVATRESTKQIAQKNFIQDIENTNLNPLTKAVLISNAAKLIKEYTNQQNVLSLAVGNITTSEGVKNVDDDWIIHFMDSVKSISDEEFQKLWALILSKECNNPGSVPKSLLFVLQRMDQRDAMIFSRFSSLIVSIFGDPVPCIFNEFYNSDAKGRGIYSRCGVSFNDLTQLEALGLVKTSDNLFSAGFYVMSDDHLENTRNQIEYFDRNAIVNDSEKKIYVGSVLLTKDGEALYRAIEHKKLEGFWDEIVGEHVLKENGIV